MLLPNAWKKKRGVPQHDRLKVRYAFIRETLSDPELIGLPISEQCCILGVSSSGYYEWLCSQKGSPRVKPTSSIRKMLSDETVLASIRRLRKLLHYTPGYRQLSRHPRRRQIPAGFASKQRIYRLSTQQASL